jgi:hypothetical protein
MAYDDYSNAKSASITSYPEPAANVPAVSGALRELAEATHALASASEAFVQVRSNLADAQARYSKLLDVVAKEREQAGV